MFDELFKFERDWDFALLTPFVEMIIVYLFWDAFVFFTVSVYYIIKFINVFRFCSEFLFDIRVIFGLTILQSPLN